MVKRYSVDRSGQSYVNEDGPFVWFQDYIALEKQLADLKRRVKELYKPFVEDKRCTATMIRRADFDRLLPEGKEES